MSLERRKFINDVVSMKPSELKKLGRFQVSSDEAEEILDAHGDPTLKKSHGSEGFVLEYGEKPKASAEK